MLCRADSSAPCELSRPYAVAAQAAAISKTTGVKRAIGESVDGGVQDFRSSQLQLHRSALLHCLKQREAEARALMQVQPCRILHGEHG